MKNKCAKKLKLKIEAMVASYELIKYKKAGSPVEMDIFESWMWSVAEESGFHIMSYGLKTKEEYVKDRSEAIKTLKIIEENEDDK